MKLFLIHGGLWEPMTAQRFWGDTGITAALTRAGHTCITPDRLPKPHTWRQDTDHLTPLLPADHFTIIAASNGSTPAIELAITAADRLTGLLLAWPATQGDPHVDARLRQSMRAQGAPKEAMDQLLAGQTLRGLTHHRIRQLPDVPTALMPAPPDSPTHQPPTIDSLAQLISNPAILPTFPEAPRPDFPPTRNDFITAVTGWLDNINQPQRKQRP